jgi:AAA+ superfamily predicted ATPase
LGIGRAPTGRFFLCGFAALILQLATVEAQGGIVVIRSSKSTAILSSTIASRFPFGLEFANGR